MNTNIHNIMTIQDDKKFQLPFSSIAGDTPCR